ncbi:recombinase family protein [Polaribacter aestuariivivens]|uniref:recombinase family protein n=1 Tax=Polaribacter aestuariivivens TaxID=2304626 RepID=UPI003F49A4ED
MIGIYARLSKEDEDSSSVENQIREGKEYANLNGYNELQTIIYNEGAGLKGSTPIAERPELKRLIKDIKSGIIKLVWTRKQSRITRKMKILEDFLEPIIEYKVKIYMGDRGLLDLALPSTKMMIQMFGAMDEFAPSTQSKETIKALTSNAKEGKVAGILPYGYSSKNMYPYIIEDEAKTINLIYDLYLDGNGAQAIATKLNEDKIPTKYQRMVTDGKERLTSNRKHRNGVIWQSSTIYGILKNTWYNGERTYQDVLYKTPKLRIVDEVKYLKVQRARELRKNKRFNDRPKYDYLLRGLIKCHKCGRNFIGRTRLEKNDNFYHCSSKRSGISNCGTHSINISKFDSFIIKHLFKSKDLLNRLENIQNSNELKNQLDKDIESVNVNLEKTKSRVKKYAKLIGDEFKDDNFILEEYQNSKKYFKQLQEKLTKLNLEKSNISSLETLNKYEKQFKEFDITADFEEIKKAVHSLIETITINTLVDVNKQLVFVIQINYLGFNESSIFNTIRPYKKWHYVSNTRVEPTNEELEDDVDLIKDIYKKKTGKELIIKKEDFHLHKQESYTDKFLEKILLNTEDLVDFNKQKRVS